ncbi:sporulation protein [Limnohabitans sp. T6-5]|uniref:SPOR domain-containing protein n=1 Tax=Limnohabitans sp. T6-5 TaxID=1100724 RepID=UPI000D34F4E6|nr:SPOR domain-containing protein [Limnohabitans sp. T6-5]PUE06383.1 sporulation protein [Limnohabitans sp. T6-5]
MTTHSQRGGTFLGFILGLVLGLGVALAVAVYVTKVPTPFSSKNQPRTTEQDNAETQKNKDWNPNSVLQPKAPAEVPAAPGTVAPRAEDKASDKPADKTSEKAADKATDKAHSDTAKGEPRPAVTADPIGDLAKSKGMATPATGNAPAGEPFDYFVQVGAYRTSADADAQKAKLALMGLDAKVSERDQAGRTVYRVRLGAYTDKAAAERVRKQLESSDIENTLVRVQR